MSTDAKIKTGCADEDAPPFPTIQLFSLSQARAVRDRLAGFALLDAQPERVEKWCRAEGNWQADIDSLMQSLVENYHGEGFPGYWLYLRSLRLAIEYIAKAESSAIRGD